MDPRIQVVYDQSHGRVPLIALDYSQRHLRQFRELMVDYTNGNLYVVSATDRDIIFSVTETIMNQISEGVVGDNIVVNIDGIGEVNLTDFLNQIRNSTITINNTNAGDFVPSLFYDNNSISIIDAKVQVNGFDTAKDGMIPQCKGGRIVWVEAGTGVGDTEIEEPDIDSSSGQNIINLSTNSINKVDNPPDTITINLPTLAANQTYAKVVLNITVGADVPQLKFPSNLKFTFNTDPNLFENCIATYEFETFDHGQIWLGKVYKYLNEPEKEVTETYIDDNFSWKTV